MGAGTEAVAVGDTIGDRYEVIAPHIWQDLQPATPPAPPDAWPSMVRSYLQAHRQRLHVPGVYDVLPQTGKKEPWVLLENAPINARSGVLFPSLAEQWPQVSAVRQLSWLWQIWQLWQVLEPLKVANSLLDVENIRVEGWRVRLLQLIS
jgi:protein phosphatase